MSNDESALTTVDDTFEIEGVRYKDQEIRQVILQSKETIDTNLRQVAKMMFVVYERSLFARWGFKDFTEYVNTDLGFSYRKANYLLNIWSWYANNVSRQEVLDAVWTEIGWSKAKELVGVINDENADEWLEKAREMNAIQLAEAARSYLKAMQGGDGDDKGSTSQSTDKSMSFKLTAAQKENIEEALQLAGKMAASEKKGHCLDLMATNFITNNAESFTRDSLDFLRILEKQFGISIVAVRNSDNTVMHGSEVYLAMLEEARKEAAEKIQGSQADQPAAGT